MKKSLFSSISILALASYSAAFAQSAIAIDGSGDGGFFIGSYSGTDTVILGNGASETLQTYQGEAVTVTTDGGRNTIFTGFRTEGGAGSGGGAGLGGVFFVDQDGTLTLSDVIFSGNSVKGGEGGSLPAQRAGNVQVFLPPKSVELIALEQLLVNPLIVDNGGAYEFSAISLSTGTDLLSSGSPIAFDELSAAPRTTIENVSNDAITLSEAIVIDPADVATVIISDGATTGYEITGNVISLTEQVAGDLDYIREKLVLNSQIFVDGSNATVTEITYGGAAGEISSFKVSEDLTGATGSLDLITVTKFNTQQFVSDGDTVTVTGATRGFEAGMELFGSDGASLGISIVSASGDSFVVSDGAALAGVSAFEARKSPVVAANQIQLASARDDFYVGGTLDIVEASFSATIIAYDPATGLVTLDQAVPFGATDILNGGDPVNLILNNIMSVDGASMTVRDSGQSFEVGMVLEGAGIDDGTTITGVTQNGGTITLQTSAPLGEVSTFLARSQLSKGGALNGMEAVGNVGNNGARGFNPNSSSAFFNEGEGVEGTRGYSGDDGSAGAGFDGGSGGDGSDGMAFNPRLAFELIDATGEFIDAVGELAAAIAPDGFPPTPDYADIPGAVIGVAAKAISLADASFNVVQWGINLERGIFGQGGDGGEGGEGGGGVDYFGGGAGGEGGRGGEGALSYTDGGDGGEGGRGGNGAFGAGGGSGGAGGDGGSTGAANGGDDGDGGFGGFGAGEGSMGSGLYGGGGSGFGGAIFVREGGSLTINGNALFQNNTASAGSSSNDGESGESAGGAIYMMKGSYVTLAPGQGNEIVFNEDIADDSAATTDGAEYAEGAGAHLTIAGDGGIVIFNAENTYSGDTIISGATLDAAFGEGIHDSSRLRFDGDGTVGGTAGGALSLGTVGTLLQREDVTGRRSGTDPFEIMWSGSGGFASGIEDGIIVNLGQTIPGE